MAGLSARGAGRDIREIAQLARSRLGSGDGDAFVARMEQLLPDLVRPLAQVYGASFDAQFLHSLLLDALDHAVARSEPLRALDRQRAADPAWFQDQRMLGYICYTDRFAGTLRGLHSHLDYLSELGVTYLHLMPVLAPRAGESDGGYAVADYDAVDPRIGTIADLSRLATELHDREIALCVDLVLNHTAREPAWARRAVAGDTAYRDFYLIYPDRVLPDAFEAAMPDIFPELAPGSFTWSSELGGWVWTTFREFQWDLNYANPAVFRAMTSTMLQLANRGADVLRLDAVPFLWKRAGTDSLNQPEAHSLLQAFRALTRIAMPGLLLKAEAMVGPEILGSYLGDHGDFYPECDLAYDNQLMVMLWSSLATRDARLAQRALSRRRPAPESTSWVTYARCHDDIGWAVADTDAAAVHLDGPAHRRFLSDFYAGDLPGSFARGARFQLDPLGESPISGTAASLCGIEAALASGDSAQLDLALCRLETLYSVVFSFGGIPLIYMGDEIALRNDPNWSVDPTHRNDNRWLHRPPMDSAAADRRHDPTALEGRTFTRLRRLAQVRASLPALRAGDQTRVLATGNPAVFAYRRATFVAVVNFGESIESIDASSFTGEHLHSTTGFVALADGRIALPPASFLWLTDRPSEIVE